MRKIVRKLGVNVCLIVYVFVFPFIIVPVYTEKKTRVLEAQSGDWVPEL
jgi:hypothetical protein